MAVELGGEKLMTLAIHEPIYPLKQDLSARGIDVMYPPAPLVAAKGDGTTNDSAAFQAVNNHLAANGGGILYIPPGTYITNFTVDSLVYVQGSGVKSTILKSAPNSQLDVIQGRDFATLTGTAKQTPETRGVRYSGIRDVLIDGNKANNTSGFGIRIWGCSWHWENVVVQNCAQDGIWTEFTTIDDPLTTDTSDPSFQSLESFFTNIKTIGNGGSGWTYNGPHDGSIINFTTFANGGWGFNQVKGSLTGYLWNSWENTTGSFNINDSLSGVKFQATGPNTGIGVQIGTSVGNVDLDVYIAGHQTGLIMAGTNVRVQGTLINNVGDAVQFNGVTDYALHVTGSGNGNVFNFGGTTHGTNLIHGNFSIPSGKTLYTGTAPSGDFIVIAGSDGTKVFNIPTSTLSVAGWKPVLPQSNGTLITTTMAPGAPGSNVRGGVLTQTAPANLTAAPTMSDFNNLLSLLKSANVLQ